MERKSKHQNSYNKHRNKSHNFKRNTIDEDENEKTESDPFLARLVGLDCEMVGVGYKGEESMLARVSMVDNSGKCIYDKYVKPRENVVDFRTHVSGIRPEHFRNALPFETVQKEVADLLKNKILVGHALRNDLKVLFLGHPRRLIRDTSTYKPIRINERSKPSLKSLAKKHLNLTIQEGEHDSIEDARSAMKIYLLHRKEWEAERFRFKRKR